MNGDRHESTGQETQHGLAKPGNVSATTASSDTSGVDLEKVRAVALDGRSWRVLATFTWAGALLVVMFLLFVDTWFVLGNLSAAYWLTLTPWLLDVVSGLWLIVALVRLRAWRVCRRAAEALGGAATPDVLRQPEGADPRVPTSDDSLIICCSGGGLKSASFCLGALQALNEEVEGQPTSLYRQAKAVVGVSGGGYIAAAYAARQNFTGNTGAPVFTPSSKEVSALRRRTNYLASSTRVKFDLIASLAVGLTVNILILGALICLFAWLLVEQTTLVHLVCTSAEPSWCEQAQQTAPDWIFNPNNRPWYALLWAPLLLALASGLYFLIIRLFSNWERPVGSPGKPESRGIGDRLGFSTPTWKTWFSNTPNSFAMIGIYVALLYPGVPYMAVQLHNVWFDHLKDWAPQFDVAAVLTAVAAFIAAVRSSIKPRRTNPETVRDQIVNFFRQKGAPWIGVGIALVGIYLILVTVTGKFLVDSTGPTGDSPWLLLVLSAVALVLARLFVSPNKTSMFPFYRERLDFAFFEQEGAASTDDDGNRVAGGSDGHTAGERIKGRRFPLADVAKTRGTDAPELVLCATANVKDGDLLPSGRNGTPFILSDYIGFTDEHLPAGAYRPPAGQYSPGGGLRSMDIATAAAISGAAVAPLAGRENKAIGPYRLLLALANIRLGVWVKNPYWTEEHDSRAGTKRGGALVRLIGSLQTASALSAAVRGHDRLSQAAETDRWDLWHAVQSAQAAAEQANLSPLDRTSGVESGHLTMRLKSGDRSEQPSSDQIEGYVSHLVKQMIRLNATLASQLNKKQATTSSQGEMPQDGDHRVGNSPQPEEPDGQEESSLIQLQNIAIESARLATELLQQEQKPRSVRISDFLDLTSPFQVIEEAVGAPRIQSPYLYLTDGGHYDNLGLVEALRRKPQRIIMLDGSGDPEDEFPAMGDAIATARMDLGVEVEGFNPRPLMRKKQSHPQKGWSHAEAVHPDGQRTTIDYVKAVLPKDLSWDLESYRLRDRQFPATSNKYELYDEFDFEAYRRLGWSLVRAAELEDWGRSPRHP